ncbi:MAG TPA: apolipoprotein N-acyltransferase [Bacteroidales bacterium]|nr:apolipoprotein N-acyltransferase [Bacteroidales bacterium]
MMVLKRTTRLAMAGLSGILMSLAYTQWNMGWVMLFAFVPLLMLEEYMHQNKHEFGGRNLFGMAFLSFIVWNLISTYWIWFATAAGSIFALSANALFMTLLFVLYHKVKLRLPRNEAYIALVVIWVAFEYFYMQVKLTWPWLNLGNAFANNVQWIQWYEYTGALGGTVWILISNLLIFEIFRRRNIFQPGLAKRINIHLIAFAIVILVPVTLSLIRYHTYEEAGKSKEVVVLQPNIDPYNTKFSGPVRDQLYSMLHLADSVMDGNTDYLVFPETALPLYVSEDSAELENDTHMQILRNFNEKYPGAKLVVGLTTRRFYYDEGDITETAHKYQSFWFDEYNTAMQVDTSGRHQMYHKSKLVPGVETLPYVDNWKWLNDLIIDLGGARNSLGYDKKPTVFHSPDDSTGVAAIICYESIYGGYITSFVRKGADLLFIITNDGWWRDTPGYKQHAAYARLRAIENRRYVARSANTGISAIINQRGDITDSRGWWQKAVIKGEVKSNDKLTFYSRFGDFAGRISVLVAALILLHYLTMLLMKKRQGQ